MISKHIGRPKGSLNKKSKKIFLICSFCLKEWLDYPSRKKNRKFCSQSCSTKKHNIGNTWGKLRKLTPEYREKMSKIMKGKKRLNISKSKMGNKNPMWTENPSYNAVHYWLRKQFGKANRCESKNCKKKIQMFDWAKLKDKKYQRKRENFIMLCRQCHIIYDKQK